MDKISYEQLPVGTGPKTIAAGDDSRIVGSLQEDEAPVALGLGSAARANREDFAPAGEAQELFSQLQDYVSARLGAFDQRIAAIRPDPIPNLGNAATADIGTHEGSVAAGNDQRIANALQARSPVAIPVFLPAPSPGEYVEWLQELAPALESIRLVLKSLGLVEDA